MAQIVAREPLIRVLRLAGSTLTACVDVVRRVRRNNGVGGRVCAARLDASTLDSWPLLKTVSLLS